MHQQLPGDTKFQPLWAGNDRLQGWRKCSQLVKPYSPWWLFSLSTAR